MLRELNNELLEVSPDDALLDKVQLLVLLGCIKDVETEPTDRNGRNAAREDFLSMIARPIEGPGENVMTGESERYDPTLNRDGTADNARGWIFNSPTGARRDTFKINSGKHRRDGYFPRPLFSGKMNIRKSKGVWGVELDLGMNFCRYCHYNRERYVTRTRNLRKLAVWTHEAPERSETGGEISLDGQDNWLQRDKLNLMSWNKVMRLNGEYLSHVERQIRWDLRNADSYPEYDGHFRPCNPEYTLNYCEIAWELTHESPVEAVNELYDFLKGYGINEVTGSEYPCSEVSEGFSRSCRLKLGNGNELAIYAKTNRRVRVEVRYRMGGSNSPLPLGSRRAGDHEELRGLFEVLRDDAVKKVNEFLGYVHSRRNPQPGHRFTVKELLDAVYSTTKASTREAVLRSLVEDQRLPPNLGGGDFLDVAKALKKRGVVRYDRPVYRLTFGYAAAAEQLKSIGMFTPRFVNAAGECEVIPPRRRGRSQ